MTLAHVTRDRPCATVNDCSGGLVCNSDLVDPAAMLRWLIDHNVLTSATDADACGGGRGLLRKLQVSRPRALRTTVARCSSPGGVHPTPFSCVERP